MGILIKKKIVSELLTTQEEKQKFFRGSKGIILKNLNIEIILDAVGFL